MAGWATRIGWRALLNAAGLIAFLVAANYLAHGIADALDFQIRLSNEDMVHRTIMTAAALYAVLLAIPFVPGAEIGLALIALLGPPIAFLVYVCTVAGLLLSFIVGRMISPARLIRLAEDIGFRRLADLLKEMEPLDQREKLEFLAGSAPNRYLPLLLRYRYLALAIAFNIPGNFLIGGGGGIALLAGVSRLYSIPGTVFAVAIAVAPVPLAVTIFGNEFLTN